MKTTSASFEEILKQVSEQTKVPVDQVEKVLRELELDKSLNILQGLGFDSSVQTAQTKKLKVVAGVLVGHNMVHA